MVSVLVSGSSGPGSSPGRGHCVVFLGRTLYSHSALFSGGKVKMCGQSYVVCPVSHLTKL